MIETIELNGTRTACELSGNGPPLLMLHGAEGSKRQFAAVRPLLDDRYTVIGHDQRDCGETENPDSPVNLAMLADDARALLQALGHETAFIFGTSFGGRVAQALALRHPQVVRRLVLGSTWPLDVSIASANPEIAQALGRLREQLPASAPEMAEIFFPPAFLEAHPEARAHFKAAPARSARSDRRAAAVADMPALDIAAIDRPTLLIAGELDRVVPKALTRALADRVPGARFVELPGVGHLATAQAPQRLADLLREFLV